jgi:acetyl esterase/lipase
MKFRFNTVTLLCALLSFWSPAYGDNTPAAVKKSVSLDAREHSNRKVVKDLSYRQGLASCIGDLYLPHSTGGLLPVVIVVHGGSWKAGSKDDYNAMDASLNLVSESFAVFNINYRLTGAGGEFPNDVADVKHAVEFLEVNAAKYSIDKTRIGIFGASAGGHLALMAAYAPNKLFDVKSQNSIKAVAAYCPLTDLKSMEVAFVVQYLGCIVEDGLNVYHKASPVSYVNTSVPTLLIHGCRDRTVPIEQSIELTQLVQQKQTKIQLVRLENADHFFSMQNGADRTIALNIVIQFFKENL